MRAAAVGIGLDAEHLAPVGVPGEVLHVRHVAARAVDMRSRRSALWSCCELSIMPSCDVVIRESGPIYIVCTYSSVQYRLSASLNGADRSTSRQPKEFLLAEHSKRTS
jgi:hypothetical protein